MAKIRKLQFNWRLMLVQIVVNALALGLTILLLPGLRIQSGNIILKLLVTGLLFGLLNAFVRPLLQFIMFRFLFITFGLVLIIINAVLLWLLGRLTPDWFQSDSLWVLLLAGILVGLLGMFFETLTGLRPPIRDDRPGQSTRAQLFSLGSAPVYVYSTPQSDTETADTDAGLKE
jgi:putative membrane protein